VENYGTLTNGRLINAGPTVDQLKYSGFALNGGATQLVITNEFNSFSGLSLGATVGGANFFFGGDSATITFPTPVTAVGMFFNVNLDSGNYGFTDSNSDSATTASATYDTSTFVFAGLTSTTPFTSIAFFSDDLAAGSYNITELEATSALASTPEPGSAQLLIAAGLLLLAGGKYRRRSMA
jgi:hypothetical protein